MTDVSKKLYVENLPPFTDTKTLINLFSLCGSIEKAEVYRYKNGIRLQNTQTLGIITFVKKEDRDKAISFDDYYYESNCIRVIKAEIVNYTVVYVGINKNMKENVFKSKMNNLFPGKIISVKFHIKVGRNNAVVNFTDEKTRQFALGNMLDIDDESTPCCYLKILELPKKPPPINDGSYFVKINNIQNIINFLGLFKYKKQGDILELERRKDYQLLISFHGERPNGWREPVEIRSITNTSAYKTPFSPYDGILNQKFVQEPKLGITTDTRNPAPNNYFYNTNNHLERLLKNFPFSIKVTNIGNKTVEELKDYFCEDRQTDVDVVIKNEKNSGKRFAFVNFKHEQDQKAALEISGRCYVGDDVNPINVIKWEIKIQSFRGSNQSVNSLTQSTSALSLCSSQNSIHTDPEYLVVVKKVPNYMDSKDIIELFKNCGTIVKQPNLISRPNGNMAFINFKEKFAVEKACRLHLPYGMFAHEDRKKW